VRAGEGEPFPACDPCYEANREGLMIVPGLEIVSARCNSCGEWGNPREFSELSKGGRWDAYSGVCISCGG
jgi:hypothetical protein